MTKSKSDFGVIGLGVMGSNLSLNIAENGYILSVFNRSEGEEAEVVQNFTSKNKGIGHILGFTLIKEFVESIEQPRKILIMIKAGKAIDYVISSIKPHLAENDILIDGGNSYYEDTYRRSLDLGSVGLYYLGCGISGGAEGARFGPSLMPSGNIDAYNLVKPILEKISAKDNKGEPCCTYIGNYGSGHFVKMVHNGIEYAEMQLLAELYALLSTQLNNDQIADVLEGWNNGEVQSFLLEITIAILRTKENDDYILEVIVDKSGNKGTGFWSVREGLQAGLPTTMMSAALYARFMSSKKNLRQKLSSKVDVTADKDSALDLDLESLKKAYIFARLINHYQGFQLISEKSKSENWNLNLSEIARIWTNGCIIRSKLMEELSIVFKHDQSILENPTHLETLKSNEINLKEFLNSAIEKRIAVDCFWSAYNFWISMTTEKLPANLIQAQRDYFGGHTFERIDKPDGSTFSHNWKSNA